MSCLGVHFALTENEVQALKEFESDEDRLSYLQEVIEEEYLASQSSFVAENDKAWDAMHRLLGDGKLTLNSGEFPLSHVVLGGQSLYSKSDYIMSLKMPEQVKVISSALQALTYEDFRSRYYSIDARDYSSNLTDDDLGYTWDSFQAVRNLYQNAANAGRYVLFTADQ